MDEWAEKWGQRVVVVFLAVATAALVVLLITLVWLLVLAVHGGFSQ